VPGARAGRAVGAPVAVGWTAWVGVMVGRLVRAGAVIDGAAVVGPATGGVARDASVRCPAMTSSAINRINGSKKAHMGTPRTRGTRASVA